MTIQTVVLCDQCDNVFATDQPPARGELIRAAHAHGWTSTYVDGNWANFCNEHEKEAI